MFVLVLGRTAHLYNLAFIFDQHIIALSADCVEQQMHVITATMSNKYANIPTYTTSILYIYLHIFGVSVMCVLSPAQIKGTILHI